MNKLLQRQLSKYITDPKQLPAAVLELLDAISSSYDHADKEREVLELALEHSSRELTELNNRLKNESQRLNAANHELNTLFENIESNFFSIDTQKNQVLQVSPQCLHIYGYTQDEFRRDPALLTRLVFKEDKQKITELLNPTQPGQRSAAEYRIIDRNGHLKWIETKITPTFDDRGRLCRIDGLSTDISKRIEAQQTIHNHETRFRKLIEKGEDGIALMNPKGSITYSSPSVIRILGYTPEEMLEGDPLRFLHPDDTKNFQQLIRGLAKRFGHSENASYRVLNQSGEWRWVWFNVTNFLKEPSIRAIVLNYKDITERLKIETQLAFDRKNTEAMINSTRDMMWSFDTNLRLITANRSFQENMKRLSGKENKPGEPLLNKKLFSQKAIQKWKKRYERVLSGESYSEEESADGFFSSWAEISFNPILENNRVIGGSCFLRDISEKKISSEIIRKSEQIMSEAQRVARFGSWTFQINRGRISNNTLEWSDGMFRIFGIDPGDRTTSFDTFFRMIHPDDAPLVTQNIEQAVANRGKFDIHYRIIRPDNSIRWVNADGEVVLHPRTGQPEKIVGTTQDITERKLAEEERQRVTEDLLQRNKDLEQFTYIISHNLRAPVAHILGLIYLIQNKKTDRETRKKSIESLTVATKRLDDIIADLNRILQVKKNLFESKELIDLKALVEEVEASLVPTLSNGQLQIHMNFSAAPGFSSIKSYMYSIFYNLISNSIKYRKPGHDPEIEIVSEKKDHAIQIVYRDNGIGIDMEQNADKVFGLYKRFHLNVEGKGIGLFMVKTQVEALGGKIEIQSEVNLGTVFHLTFPQA